jgi:hypothetical protein
MYRPNSSAKPAKNPQNICASNLLVQQLTVFCAACADEHENENMMLPVTNSPRMGECGYEGELDTFEFDPRNLPKK